MGCSKSSSKREVYSNTSLPQKTRKISNKQANPTPKGTREKKEIINKGSGIVMTSDLCKGTVEARRQWSNA